MFYTARRKMPGVPESVVLELAAQAMQITVESLRGCITWNEEYMRWQDGDPDYRVLTE